MAQMHQHKIVASVQISLILSILNLGLAALVVLWEIYEARDGVTVMVAAAKDATTMPKEWRKLEVPSGRLMSPPLGSS